MFFCCRILIVLFLLATVASTLSIYPHELCYFNEVSGGPSNGYRHLLGSNLDWGQDIYLATEELLTREGVTEEEVCWRFYPMLPPGLSPQGDCPQAVLEVVSINYLASPRGPGLQQLSRADGRIGYTAWYFRRGRNERKR